MAAAATRLRILFAAAVLLVVSRTALADPRVLLVGVPGPDPVLSEAFHRLRAELSLKGFDVETVQVAPQDGSPEALAALATRQGALACIALTRRTSPPVADVWIADRVTGKTSIRTLELSEGPEAPSVLAVRAADLLRSSLGEFGPATKPPPDVTGVDPRPVPSAVTRFAGPPPTRFRIAASAAVVGVGQSLGMAFAPRLAVSLQLGDRIGAGLSFAGPALGATYVTADGNAVVTQELGLANVWVTALRTGVFEVRGVADVGLYHFDAHGEVAPPLASRQGGDSSFAAGLGLEAAFRLGSRITWQIEGTAVDLEPRPSIALLSNAYEFAWPFGVVATGLAVDF